MLLTDGFIIIGNIVLTQFTPSKNNLRLVHVVSFVKSKDSLFFLQKTYFNFLSQFLSFFERGSFLKDVQNS